MITIVIVLLISSCVHAKTQPTTTTKIIKLSKLTTSDVSIEEKDTTIPDFVEPGLWLGGIKDVVSSSSKKRQRQQTITTTMMTAATVDCRFCHHNGCRFPDRSPTSWKEVNDNVHTLKYLAKYIHERRRTYDEVLVHCYMGKNRGPASLVAYYLLYEDLTLVQAFAKVRLARPRSKTWDNTFILELKQIAQEEREEKYFFSSPFEEPYNNNKQKRFIASE